jgi:hypothetical protein
LAVAHVGRNSIGGTNSAGYTNDYSLVDSYWAAGLNNSLTTAGTNGGAPLDRTALDVLTAGTTPAHDIVRLIPFAPWVMTNAQVLPACGGSAFMVFTNQRPVNPTNRLVQVVMVNTNGGAGNLAVNVEFITPPVANSNAALSWLGATSMVQFVWLEKNIVDGKFITNSLYLLDSPAVLTNGGLLPNLAPAIGLPSGTMRPANYELTRGTPAEWTNLNAVVAAPGPAPLAPQFFNPNTPFSRSTNPLVSISYSAYSAQIGAVAAFNNFFAPRPNPAINDPTNQHGKVEITGYAVNVQGTRIRAENFVGIQAARLENDTPPLLDTPILNFDVGFSQAGRIPVGFLPKTLTNRLGGVISAYSAVWSNVVAAISVVFSNGTAIQSTNYETTLFHVLVVDNCLQPPSAILNKFAIHAPSLVVEDDLSVVGSMLLAVTNLTIGEFPAALKLPANWSLGPSNMPGLVHLTNSGVISVPLSANFSGAAGPLDDFVNHGIITADSMNIAARYFENSGTTLSVPQAQITASNGTFKVVAQTAVLNSGLLANNLALELRANTLDITATVLQAGSVNSSIGLPLPGKLTLSVTNRLSDGSSFDTNTFTWQLAGNEWRVTDGFQVAPRPATGNLLGTTIRSTLVDYGGSGVHVWPARNLGASPAAFTTNLAVGKLVLDGGLFTTFRFEGPDPTNAYALYVDYLELANDATNALDPARLVPVFDIATNFTLYFADANLTPKKLEFALPGRLVWVRDSFSGNANYVGPYSSTLYTNAQTGVVVGLNTALATDCDFDSNQNGTVNCEDPWPIITPYDVQLKLKITGEAPQKVAEVKWLSPARTTNILEYTTSTSFTAPVNWTVLTNFVQGSEAGPQSYRDPVVGPQRHYRVRVYPR